MFKSTFALFPYEHFEGTAVTFWNVEALGVQDINYSLGNCCGFAQIVRKCRRGLLTLRRGEKKHISRLFPLLLTLEHVC